MRRTLAIAAVASTAVLGLQVPASADDYFVPVTDRLELTGHGYGHGRGMSQYGAKGAGEAGLTWRQIMAFYYPGTGLGSSSGRMRVLVTADTTKDLVVKPASGLRVRDLGTGATWPLASPTASTDQWALRVSSANKVFVQYHDRSGWHTVRTLAGEGEFYAAVPLTLVLPGGATRAYRESLRTAQPSGGSFDRNTVNDVSLENYVQGVIPSEMPPTWSPAAVRAQAVAARTYAVRHRSVHPNRYFHVDDTVSYQVYRGFSAEHPASNAAASDTAGVIVTYGGAPALTEFSSSSGGWTSGSDLPYQVVKRDGYDAPSGNPNHVWHSTEYATTLERAYPAVGSLQRIEVTERNGAGDWGGRIERAVLHGTGGSVAVSGSRLRSVLGLKSDWFAIAPTPIIARWHQTGGAAYLGRILTAELAVPGGAEQRFDRGSIYWSAATGAREVLGSIRAAYRYHGATRSALGFPVTGELDAGVEGARFNSFQRGGVYWSRDTGAHTVLAGINARYHHVGGAVGIGLPTADEADAGVPGGRVSTFQRGTIYWSRDTGPHAIYGAIMALYRGLGGPARLGLPTADEAGAGVPGGRVSTLQGADIYWSRATGPAAVLGAVRATYRAYGGPAGSGLGLPLDEEYAVTGGTRQDFQGGWIHWDPVAKEGRVFHNAPS